MQCNKLLKKFMFIIYHNCMTQCFCRTTQNFTWMEYVDRIMLWMLNVTLLTDLGYIILWHIKHRKCALVVKKMFCLILDTYNNGVIKENQVMNDWKQCYNFSKGKRSIFESHFLEIPNCLIECLLQECILLNGQILFHMMPKTYNLNISHFIIYTYP